MNTNFTQNLKAIRITDENDEKRYAVVTQKKEQFGSFEMDCFTHLPFSCEQECSGIGVTKAEEKANAFLYAAAPEMYSCLEEAVAEMCKDCPGKKADACNLEDGECIANKWINTLKKARGEK